MRTLNRKNILICIPTAIFMASIALMPEKTSTYAQKGLLIWYNNILPFMLPFLMTAIFSSKIGLSDIIAKLFSKPIGKILNVSGYGAFALICAILSGYPAGAKITASLIKEKKISLSDGKKIFILSNVTSPAFIVGSVGTGMFGNKTAGIIILLCHYISAFILCLILGIKDKRTSTFFKPEKTSRENFSKALSSAAASSAETLITVCCFVVLFSVLSGFMTEFHITPCSLLGLNIPLADDIFSSLIEMTTGCRSLSQTVTPERICAAAFAVSFGGACIYFQILSVTENCGIKPLYVLFVKLLHGAFSVLVLRILFFLFVISQ